MSCDANEKLELLFLMVFPKEILVSDQLLTTYASV